MLFNFLRPAALALVLAVFPLASTAATTFRVAVPASTPSSDTVFIAGDFQGWNPGHPAYALSLQADGRWTITLNLPDGQPIEFKFTRGNWARVEKGPSGEEIANRMLTPSGDQTHDFNVATWADLGTITGHVESFSHPPFLAGRRCWVYLPPGYDSSSDRYPVLYMHDGQNLFDVRTSFAGEWRVDEACEELIPAGEIEPIIVVGIENSAARCVEYTPWVDPSIPCGGGGGDLYLSAIRDVLIPEVNARYRTRTGPDNTYMSGSSLGGLISTYAAYAYDDVFGRIAGVSTYFPWADRMLLTYAAGQPRPNLSRFYQDMGTLEFGFTDADSNGIDDFIEDLRAMRDIALGQGFVEGVDYLSVEGQEHTHWEFWWAQRFPDLLRFLIDRPSSSAPPGEPSPVLLLGPTPNPSFGTSWFEFVIEKPAAVRIDVFDHLGRRVRSLAGREFHGGRHTVAWDGRTDRGRPVPAGVYRLRFSAAGTILVRSIVRVG